MIRTAAFVVSALSLFTAPSLRAATFTATAEGNTVTVYSTSTKPEHCAAGVKFTYLEGTTRKDGWTSCEEFMTKPGKNVEVCHFTNPQLIAPILNGDVVSACPPKKRPE